MQYKAIRGCNVRKQEKIEKYQPLWDEIGKLCGMREVIVILVVTGEFGAVSKGFEKRIDIGAAFKLKEKKSLLGTVCILRKVLLYLCVIGEGTT